MRCQTLTHILHEVSKILGIFKKIPKNSGEFQRDSWPRSWGFCGNSSGYQMIFIFSQFCGDSYKDSISMRIPWGSPDFFFKRISGFLFQEDGGFE